MINPVKPTVLLTTALLLPGIAMTSATAAPAPSDMSVAGADAAGGAELTMVDQKRSVDTRVGLGVLDASGVTPLTVRLTPQRTAWPLTLPANYEP